MKKEVYERIKSFNAVRQQRVLPIKYKAMAQNSFAFFRGTCHLFYEDLLKNYPFAASPLTWTCGDLHIENFGSYKGANQILYFDLNDFDESIAAPLLFEIARLLVSVELTTSEIKFSKKERSKILQQLLHHYRNTLLTNKAQNIEQATSTGLIKGCIEKVHERKEKSLLAMRTNNKIKGAHLLINERLLPIKKEEKKLLANEFTEWFSITHAAGFRVTDAGFRIAGTGSIGVKRYLCLLENIKNPRQKKLMDVKQALPSCILQYKKILQPVWQNEADRIIKTQEMMQHVSPAFLSSFQFKKDWYVAKEIQPTSDKITIGRNVKQDSQLAKYVADLGLLTASAQLRSSGRLQVGTADELRAFAESDTWMPLLTTWCLDYAQQVKTDYATFYKARKAGFFLK